MCICVSMCGQRRGSAAIDDEELEGMLEEAEAAEAQVRTHG